MEDNSIIKENRNQLGLTKTIVLVGLMGAGKSTIGRRLAAEIGVRFVDSDNEIADAAECNISDIFEIYGEAIFRDLEKRVIIRLLGGEPLVLATGGGAFMNPEVQAAVKEHGVSIWLKADIEVLLERVSRKNTRPLLESGDKRVILTKLMNEREALYARADITVNNDMGEHDKVVANIVDILRGKELV